MTPSGTLVFNSFTSLNNFLPIVLICAYLFLSYSFHGYIVFFVPNSVHIMEQYFSAPYPARAAIGVASLPKGVAVEMDAILGAS